MRRMRSTTPAVGVTTTIHKVVVDRDISFPFDVIGDPRNNFYPLSNIGSGALGTVYQILHIPNKKILAGKFIHENIFDNEKLEDFLKSIEEVEKVLSPYAVRYFGHVTYKNKQLILMEYCERGSLRDIMDERKQPLTEEQISIVMLDVIRALVLLKDKHSMHHCNLKASNIMITSNGFVKLNDFHIYEHIRSGKTYVEPLPYWSSPSILQCHHHDTISDLWALGATAVELAEGSPPLTEYPPSAAAIRIVEGGFAGFRREFSHSENFRDFVKRCLAPHSKTAPLEDLLKHPFVAQAEHMTRSEILESLISAESVPERVRPPEAVEEIGFSELPTLGSLSMREYGRDSFTRSASISGIARNMESNQNQKHTFKPIMVLSERSNRQSNSDLGPLFEDSIFSSEDSEISEVKPPELNITSSNSEVSIGKSVKFIPFVIADELPQKAPEYGGRSREGPTDLRRLLTARSAPNILAWSLFSVTLWLFGLKGVALLLAISLVVYIITTTSPIEFKAKILTLCKK